MFSEMSVFDSLPEPLDDSSLFSRWPIIYICQDGMQPSGVASYGYFLMGELSGKMLLLNAERAPDLAPESVRERIIPLSETVSHDPKAVAAAIQQIVAGTSGNVTILPNTGDTPWAAIAVFLRVASDDTRNRIRVLGVVHSDVETQYGLAEMYRSIAPCWIGVSQRCFSELERRIGGRETLVRYLPYPMNIPDSEIRHHSGPLRMAYVGRIEEDQKKVSRLVCLFRRLVSRGVEFRATIVGSGAVSQSFIADLESAGAEVSKRVVCEGALDRVAVDEVWRSNEIALLVSSYEGLPIAILEAMSAGVCPVAMEISSGLGDLVLSGENGIIVPQGDVDAMADALCGLSCDRERLMRVRISAKNRIKEHFSPRVHMEKLVEVMETIHLIPVGSCLDLAPDPTQIAVDRIVEQVVSSGRRACIYGAGMIGRKVIDRCLDRGVSVCAWFDSDPGKIGKDYRGLTCEVSSNVINYSDAVFVAASLQFAYEMIVGVEQVFINQGMPRPAIVSHLS